MLGNGGAKQAMEWLFTNLAGKSHLDHLLAKKFTKDDIVTMIGECWRETSNGMAFY